MRLFDLKKQDLYVNAKQNKKKQVTDEECMVAKNTVQKSFLSGADMAFH